MHGSTRKVDRDQAGIPPPQALKQCCGVQGREPDLAGVVAHFKQTYGVRDSVLSQSHVLP